MKLIGQYSTDGEYRPYCSPIKAIELNGTLRDEDGFLLAIKDDYGDWVSPTMHNLGLKSRIKVQP